MTYHGQGLGVAEQTRLTARAAYAAGQSAFDAGRYKEALTAFQRAYRTIPNPVVLIAMAKTQERLGQPDQALLKFREYLWADPEGAHAATARSAVRRLSPPEPTAPSLPPEGAPVAPMESGVPSTSEAYGGATTVGVWVATGVGVAALLGLVYWRTRKPKRNRRRRPRR